MGKLEKTIIKRINQKIILAGWFAVMSLLLVTNYHVQYSEPKQKIFQRKSISVAGLERVRDQWETVFDDEQDKEAPVKRLRPLHFSTLREWIRRVYNEPETRNNAEDCPTAA